MSSGRFAPNILYCDLRDSNHERDYFSCTDRRPYTKSGLSLRSSINNCNDERVSPPVAGRDSRPSMQNHTPRAYNPLSSCWNNSYVFSSMSSRRYTGKKSHNDVPGTSQPANLLFCTSLVVNGCIRDRTNSTRYHRICQQMLYQAHLLGVSILPSPSLTPYLVVTH